jgi:hypothetical protein
VAIVLSPNDVIVFGTPGVLSVWGFDLVRAAAATLAHADIRIVDRTEEVTEVQAAPDRPRIFCLSQYPSPSLAGIIGGAHLPVIAFLDEPIDAVRFLKETHGCSFVEALRAQTAAATACAVLRDNPRVLLINRSVGGLIGGITAQVLNQLRIHVSDAAMATFIDTFMDAPDAAKLPLESALARRVLGYARSAPTSTTAYKEAAVISQVLVPMMMSAVRHNVEPICWPSAVFLSGDRPNEAAPLVADLTGAARVIYYGPYFYLPAGRWQVRITLGFSEDIFGTPLSLQVHGSELVAKTLVKPADAGLFRVSFPMVHLRPQDPLELRICSDEGAIEGRIGLSRVQLIPEFT